jgi:FADH2 O2-dependent halogenase
MDFDIAVLGSGFGGSIISMVCRRLGYSTVMIDRVSHPRFAIGESSTPFSNLLLEEIAVGFDLPQLSGFVDWGHWQSQHHNIACGLKRGFSFFHHQRGCPFVSDSVHSNELLVAASPRECLADTHWFRSELDAHLVRESVKLGVEFLDKTDVAQFYGLEAGPSVTLSANREGHRFELGARYVIDASGPRGAVHSALALGELPAGPMPSTQTLFAHFRNVSRWDEHAGSSAGTSPYAADDAAVHHVFEGGWIWILRFNNGVVSAGISALESFSAEFRLWEGAVAWDRVLKAFPSIAELFLQSKVIEPFRYQRNSTFRSGRSFGYNWSLLPAAAGFIDPLLSTGFSLNLFGILRLASALRTHRLGSEHFDREMAEIARQGGEEMDAVSRLVGALFRTMGNFDRFRSLTLLYFAAMSYSETAWRLDRKKNAKTFLLCDRLPFADQLNEICKRADDPAFPVQSAVAEAIEPINVAGLGLSERNHWYPVESSDLLDSYRKLGVSRAAVETFLKQFNL